MNYEGQICRGPMERSSYMLPVAVGCSYNRCKFCTLFRHLKYRELPMEQIEAELERVRSLGGNPKHVFLGDGNAFGLATKRLLEITDLIHRYFPGCQAINMDGTITNIQAKSREELLALRKAGICHLYLGIESGLDDVLRYMGKDHNLDQAYRQIDRIQRAGFIFDAHIMTGIAGHGRGLENGTATAEFFNRTQPQRIINFSMFLFRSAPLFQEAQAKTFIPATELENLQEERLLLELLKTDGPLAYDGFHDRIEFRVRGTLPDNRKNMLNKLDLAIEGYRDHEPVIAVTDDSSGPLPAQTMTAI
ncbi:radical SAM protein [Enterocloster bolteae]|uniref:radical SAM protein n=1 Tax=Enterocloster bolteae TaxID=208479 RepID=UPI00210E5B3A|nr:radical SAM protein [Enterocloster bolteae]MCQ5141165.1 radical SAM protein [Enterocloster bolteae]